MKHRKQLRKQSSINSEVLYEKYYPYLYPIAYETSNDKTVAENILYKLFSYLSKNLHHIKDIDSAETKSFLCTLCRCFSHQHPDFSQEPVTDDTHSSADIVITQDSLNLSVEAIMQLNPISRDIFLLSNAYHLPDSEIAKIFCVSEEIIFSQRTQAIHTLTKALEQNTDQNK